MIRKEAGQLKHVMTFEAHRNTLLQLNIEMHISDLYSLAKDNILKVWTVSSNKTKNLASRIPQT